MEQKSITKVTDPKLQKYPGSELTIAQINELGAKMEKLIFDSLPETKLFTDVEIILLQFIGAMICGSLRKPGAIRRCVTSFSNKLHDFTETWIKVVEQQSKLN